MLAAQGDVYGYPEQSVEVRLSRGRSASPEFGGADGGVEDQRVRSTEFEPLRHNGLVPTSQYLYQDVRIGKDGHRSSLEPRRSSLTFSLLSAAFARDFRIPTKLCRLLAAGARMEGFPKLVVSSEADFERTGVRLSTEPIKMPRPGACSVYAASPPRYSR